MRPQLELEVGIDYAPAGVGDEGQMAIGYIANSNHVGAYASIFDNSNTLSRLQALLATNDGDDTFTNRYVGSALSGTGARTYRFRCKNGCVSVWDDQDDAWHDYAGRQNAGIAYTAAWAFVQMYKYTGATFWTVYLQSLKLKYLD